MLSGLQDASLAHECARMFYSTLWNTWTVRRVRLAECGKTNRFIDIFIFPNDGITVQGTTQSISSALPLRPNIRVAFNIVQHRSTVSSTLQWRDDFDLLDVSLRQWRLKRLDLANWKASKKMRWCHKEWWVRYLSQSLMYINDINVH